MIMATWSRGSPRLTRNSRPAAATCSTLLDLLDLLLTDIQDGDGDVTVDGDEGWVTFER